MLKFGDHVQHILDCPETAKPENARMRAFLHTHRVRQICPLLIPVVESEIDRNKETREQVTRELTEAKLNMEHAKLGLKWIMHPKN
jgi:hypothetical protein